MIQANRPAASLWVKSILMCTLLAACQSALAAGGLGNVESGLKEFLTSFYGIVAIIAGFALLACAMMGMADRMGWGEVVVKCGWIIFAAASLAIVKYLWDLGKNVSF